MSIFDIFWLFLILSSLQPVVAQRYLAARRTLALRALEQRNHSRGITLIHRKEAFSFLGIPFGGYIDIDDSEQVIRAVEMTDADVPIDLVLHTPGGLVLAAEQIAGALAGHAAPVTVYVPHYAMSGGTLIALAADRIVMSPSAVLGPVDPQIGNWPAASILAAVEQKDKNEIDDDTLIMADIGRKAQQQVLSFVEDLLRGGPAGVDAPDLARTLTDGRWTHDFPIDATRAAKLGLPISTELPREVQQLMRLYPQPRNRRPSVEYIPMPYEAPVHRRERSPASPTRRSGTRFEQEDV
jgi:ClpP class serine protease